MTALGDPSRTLLDQLGGDVRLLHEVIDLFLGDTPRMLHSLDTYLSRGDGPAACRMAHTLKGSTANFDAPTVTELARSVEVHAREGHLDAATSVLKQLDAAVQRLLADLRAVREHTCAC